MKLEHRVDIAAPADRVWSLLMDLPAAARCVPGARDLAPDGADRATGTLDVRVGPIRLALSGAVTRVERDDAARRATLRADAEDPRLAGAVRALVAVAVSEDGTGRSALEVRSDVAIIGRIGELGQPLIARQADRTLAAFAANVGKALAG